MLRGGCAAWPAACDTATGCGDGATCATPVATPVAGAGAGAAVAGAAGAGVLALDGYTGSMLALPGSTAIPGLLTPAEPATWHGTPLKKRQDRHACAPERSEPVIGCSVGLMPALPA